MNISLTSFYVISDLKFSYASLCLLKAFNRSYFRVRTLDLSRNNISTVYANTIKGLFTYLILEENIIASFESNAFGSMPNLVDINFANNVIRHLHFDDAFEFNQSRVNKLDFSFNEIKALFGEFFVRFPNLKQLDLSNNNLLSLGNNGDFFWLNNLEILYLSNNQILTIRNVTFRNLACLKYLNLHNNLLYDLNERLFRGLSKLERLILSKNKIEFIENQHFTGLASLIVLDLSENALKSLESRDLFDKMPLLKTLLLGSNRIQSINNSIPQQIEELDLSLNKMRLLNFSSTTLMSPTKITLNLAYTSFKYDRSRVVDLRNSTSLKVFNLSSTNSDFILGLNFSSANLNIEELDLSFNDLSLLPKNYFASLVKLTRLYMQKTNLIRFEYMR